MSSKTLLEIDGLEKYFSQSTGFVESLFGDSNKIQAVDGVSFSLGHEEVVGIIGESGCGKTTLLKTLIGLHKPTNGEIRFKGTPLSSFGRSDWKEFRRNVQIIFQDPFNSLDPKMSVREILFEPLKIHNEDATDERALEILEKVELQPPEEYLHQLPQQLSGGEKQRVSIARALMVDPNVLLADEPVSMLDVSTQASVLNLLSDLTSEFGVSIVYISHDLSTVGQVCDLIKVMYLGRIVESAQTSTLLESPQHPYTQALVSAVPIPDPHHERSRTQLEGSTTDPINLGEGCRFRDRCPERMEVCGKTPESVQTDSGNQVACHLYYDHEEPEDGQSANRMDSSSDVSKGGDL